MISLIGGLTLKFGGYQNFGFSRSCCKFLALLFWQLVREMLFESVLDVLINRTKIEIFETKLHMHIRFNNIE